MERQINRKCSEFNCDKTCIFDNNYVVFIVVKAIIESALKNGLGVDFLVVNCLLTKKTQELMSTRRNIKYRYLKTKIALNETVQRILDINRKRRFFGEDPTKKEQLNEELKVLNAVAENQALRLKSYEVTMNRENAA